MQAGARVDSRDDRLHGHRVDPLVSREALFAGRDVRVPDRQCEFAAGTCACAADVANLAGPVGVSLAVACGDARDGRWGIRATSARSAGIFADASLPVLLRSPA